MPENKYELVIKGQKKSKYDRYMKVASVLGIIACIIFIIYGWKMKIFTSEEALREFLAPLGIMGPLVFIFIQAVQVVIPILPGAIGCLGGVILFGPLMGFVYNYIGICIGSIIAFLIAKKVGMGIVESAANNKKYAKYFGWLGDSRFDKWFAIAIFLPVAPDDFLCYLAGVTKMKLRKFTAIILLGKPLAIAAYSLGLQFTFARLLQLAP